MWCLGKNIVFESQRYFVYGHVNYREHTMSPDTKVLAIRTDVASVGLDHLLTVLPGMVPCETDNVRSVAKDVWELYKVPFDVEPLLVELSWEKVEDTGTMDDDREGYWASDESSSSSSEYDEEEEGDTSY